MYVGTSSWKYPGWIGSIYSDELYLTRGRFSQAKFDRTCLQEYARTFKTVCIDAAFYQFPSARYLDGLMGEVPPDFKFGMKVTDEITIKHFPRHPRHGSRGGEDNPNFLNVELFCREFLDVCTPYRDNIGVLIFEFSQFYQRDYERGRDFVADLDRFLGKLPTEWQYGVEIRNEHFLKLEYLDVLRQYGVAHTYSNWTRMPPVSEQLQMEGSRTADFTVSRFLLKPGRSYEQAVKSFQPYDQVKDQIPEARLAIMRLVNESAKVKRDVKSQKISFLFVNNRLEGSAPTTIAESILP